MAILELDFSNAPARQGGGITLIPPGPYVLQIVGVDDSKVSAKGNPMVQVDFQVIEGAYFGEEFSDYFAPVPPPPGASLNGMQKFHALLLACGFTISTPKVKLDLQKLVNRKCTANIATEPMQATAKYPDPRDASKIRSYELPSAITSPPSSNGNGASSTPAAAAAPVEVPVAKAAPAKAAPAAEATEPEAVTVPADGLSVDSSGDDLFS